MGIEFTSFRAGHLQFLHPQALQRLDHADLMTPGYAEILENGFGLSGWEGSKCVAVAGVLPVSPFRAVGWTVLSEDASPYMLKIVKKVRSVMDGLPYRRIEITVTKDFEQGHKFARLIGMKLETPEPMIAYGMRGDDEYMYARVK